MSKKANPVVIGMFVVVAAAIFIGAILVLGSGTLFQKTETCVLFFEGDMSGLDVGAPVEYRGVRVGTVSAVYLEYDTEGGDIRIPVYIEFEEDRLQYKGAADRARNISEHIERGLRAQLQSQSFVTGKLKVSLVEAPESPMNLVGGDPLYTEIPTIPGMLESLVDHFEELPLEDIVTDIHAATKAIAEIGASGELQSITDELKQALVSLNQTLQESREAIAELRMGIQPVGRETIAAMEELSGAAQSARYLLDYLERHPEALLHGKGDN